MSESDLVTQDDAGTPLRWRSPAGVMHAVERTRVTSRTRCGREVDAAETWAGRDTLSCKKCFAIEHEDRLREDHRHHASSHGA
jgi:hypothetical protein